MKSIGININITDFKLLLEEKLIEILSFDQIKFIF